MSTIAAISTPNAVGGIAMIRISGENAVTVADAVFRPAGDIKTTQMRGYSCAYGHIYDADEPVDDVVLTVFRAPHSFTGEDTLISGATISSNAVKTAVYDVFAAFKNLQENGGL